MAAEDPQARLKALRLEALRREQARRAQQQGQPLLSRQQPGQPLLGTAEPMSPAMNLLATAGSGMVAEPAAGLAGLATMAVPGFGAEQASDVVERVRNALTVPIQPQTAEALSGLGGQLAAGMSALEQGRGTPVAPPQLAAQVPQPVLESVRRAGERFTGLAGAAGEAFGPAAGAAVQTAPVLAMELTGIRAGRTIHRAANRHGLISRRRFARELTDAAPTIEDLQRGAREIYTELDDAGIRISQADVSTLSRNANKALNPRSLFTAEELGTLGPQTRALATALERVSGNADGVMLSDLMALRDRAQEVRRAMSKPEAGIRDFINEIDSYIDNLSIGQLGGARSARVGDKLSMARDLWRRSKRSEMVTEVIDQAREGLSASGFENGVRQGFTRLLKNKKEARFFTAEERKAMAAVARGEGNLFKALGRLGPFEGRATNMTTTLLGAGLGFQFGGPVGAVLVPMVGAVSKKTAQWLTAKGADKANRLIRAGSDGRAITELYLQAVPAARRNSVDLASLLVRPDVQLAGVPATPFNQQAIQRVQQARGFLHQALAAGGGALGAAAPVAAGSITSQIQQGQQP